MLTFLVRPPIRLSVQLEENLRDGRMSDPFVRKRAQQVGAQRLAVSQCLLLHARRRHPAPGMQPPAEDVQPALPAEDVQPAVQLRSLQRTRVGIYNTFVLGK